MNTAIVEQHVVIIGGSSGIGLATAQAAATEGAYVYIAGRSQDKLRRAVKTLEERGLGNRVKSLVVDAADESSVKTMFDQIERVDHVFVTASQIQLGSIADTETEKLKLTLDSKFWGSYYAAKYAAPKMNGQGSITFMSGTASLRPSPGTAVAAASAAAVEALGRALALELSPIRVNAISAGAIDTPLLDTFFGDGRSGAIEHLTRTLPVKRMGQPEHVAHAALYLMTNDYSTGTVLSVDGGALLI